MTGQQVLEAPNDTAIEAIRGADLVARYTFAGDPERDNFDVSVVIAGLNGGDVFYDRKEKGFVAPVASAAQLELAQRYSVQDILIDQKIREGTSFAYGKAILLRGLVTEAKRFSRVVERLTDNKSLRAEEFAWQTSVVGFVGIRGMQRALFLAGGNVEINVPIMAPRERVQTEVRADILSYLGAKALDVFTAMPPTPPT